MARFALATMVAQIVAMSATTSKSSRRAGTVRHAQPLLAGPRALWTAPPSVAPASPLQTPSPVQIQSIVLSHWPAAHGSAFRSPKPTGGCQSAPSLLDVATRTVDSEHA